ncbi:MAG: multicopper oxidase domain-containing protein [Deltaproteobacteria bacterium]|nr:multicopper oxidase domain-containing protein [Deltaproteobacteria bacterium]
MKKIKVLISSSIFMMLFLFYAAGAQAMIDGVGGTTFNLTAKEGRISTADGNSIYAWGYANGNGAMQYPGVTMIVNQGDAVTVNLTNQLPIPVSIVFPGQKDVAAIGGSAGLLTREAATGQTVKYTFVASEPGTYIYYSGSRPELQVEMGLVGAIIVRPQNYDPNMPRAYNHAGSEYDRETLFLLTEMDSRIHETVEFLGVAGLNTTDYLSNYFPNYWFINGRTAPDTMAPSFAAWFPTQPYNSMPIMHPGERLLMRVVNAGRDLHPFHHHGNHARVIAWDGKLLESAAGAGPDIGPSVFTIQSVPGTTADAIFEWTGKGLGWDIYGSAPHACIDTNADGFDDASKEYCPDHGKPFPVVLPDIGDLTVGGFYGGSPFLGTPDLLPPGQGGMNPNAGYVYMWHSHTEKEMTNFDIFPGGMMTMLIIEAPTVPIQ